MKRSMAFLLVLVLNGIVFGTVPLQSDPSPALVFTNVNVIDMRGAQTATLNPARFLNRQHDWGTIAPGKLADLVLLDDNPLLDIRNTQRINAVVVNGQLINRSMLDRMLHEIETSASAQQ